MRSGWMKHISRETTEIKLHPSNMNRAEGFSRSKSWKPPQQIMKEWKKGPFSKDKQPTPEPALLMISLYYSCETDPLSALFRTNLHPLHTAPYAGHYLALLSLLEDPMYGGAIDCFSLSLRRANLPGVLTVVTHVITNSLLTATQAHSWLARSWLLTGILVPVVPGRSNH